MRKRAERSPLFDPYMAASIFRSHVSDYDPWSVMPLELKNLSWAIFVGLKKVKYAKTA